MSHLFSMESTMVMSSASMSFQEHGLGLQVLTNRWGNGATVAGGAAATEMPWWAGAESFGQSSALAMDVDGRHHHPLAADQQPHCSTYPKPGGPAMPPEGGEAGKFPVISGDWDLGDDLKFHDPLAPTVPAYPLLPEYQGRRFELTLELGQSRVSGNYGNADQGNAAYWPYGAQAMQHGKVLLPSVNSTDVPVYVNAKQFNGIFRRRLARARAGRSSEKKLSKNRKPYLHESRHLHALRRVRGSGGRFLAKGSSGDHAVAVAGGDASVPPQPWNIKARPAKTTSVAETANDRAHGCAIGQHSQLTRHGCTSAARCSGSSPFPSSLASTVHGGGGSEASWVTAATCGCCDLLKV